MGRWTESQMDLMMDRDTDRWTDDDRWRYGRMDLLMDRCTDRWRDGQMEGQRDGGMGG